MAAGQCDRMQSGNGLLDLIRAGVVDLAEHIDLARVHRLESQRGHHVLERPLPVEPVHGALHFLDRMPSSEDPFPYEREVDGAVRLHRELGLLAVCECCQRLDQSLDFLVKPDH